MIISCESVGERPGISIWPRGQDLQILRSSLHRILTKVQLINIWNLITGTAKGARWMDIWMSSSGCWLFEHHHSKHWSSFSSSDEDAFIVCCEFQTGAIIGTILLRKLGWLSSQHYKTVPPSFREIGIDPLDHMSLYH